MTETKEQLWRPVVGSLAVISGTGTSARVINFQKHTAVCELAILKLEDNLYLNGVGGDDEQVIDKDQTIQIQYEPDHDNPAKIKLFYQSGKSKSAGDMILEITEHRNWKLVQHPNDGAPKTKDFHFNHWVCWENGKHEGFEPEWRGGYNYDHNKSMPCADVKVHNPGKYLTDRTRVEENIGKLTDAQWGRYVEWVEDEAESDHHAFDLAIESAREGVENCFENTGLEYAFGGRSGGWLCITNAPTEDDWNANGLSAEEIERVEQLERLNEKEGLCEVDHDEMSDLQYRRDEHNGFKGDKAVIRSALAQADKYAEDEVAYQFMGIMASRFQGVLDEEEQDEKEKNERNAGREIVKGFIDTNFAEITKKEMIGGLEAFDVGAKSDGWLWTEPQEPKKKE